MVKLIEEANWKTFLQDYAARHRGEPTRVGVFETREGVTNDYWIDDGLLLVTLDVDSTYEKPNVEAIFENYAHTVEAATNLVLVLGEDGRDLGLDILDENGNTTLIRFEDWLNKKSED